MKNCFLNIFNMVKTRRCLAVVYIVIVAISLAGSMVACSSSSSSAFQASGTVYALDRVGRLVVSYDAGNSYLLDEQGNISISYNNGDVSAKTPLTVDVRDIYTPGMELYQTGFYIAPQKTAIAYGGDAGPIQVLVSEDMGKTWNTYAVEGSEYNRDTKMIGFITKDNGWLVASPGSALGTSQNHVYLTTDGGKTWTETGNPNDQYARNMTGAGFSTEEIGFIGYRVDAYPGPTIYWTQDGGKTWEEFDMPLPAEFDNFLKTPLSPFFIGSKGIWPISLSSSQSDKTIYMTSNDYGKTWTYDQSYIQVSHMAFKTE